MAILPTNTKRRTSLSGDSEMMLLTENSPWPVQEAYKALRTNITFSMPSSGCHVISFSSAFAGDGKSINCLNTAIAFGQIGKKVLLIECDLRLPTIGLKLGIPSAPGLTDVLVGQKKLIDVLHRNTEWKIDILTAGNIPPDPTWLLQSDQMKTLVDATKQVYDYIFIDLPPVNTVADASIMSKHIDGFLLVVRHEVTELPAIQDALTQLQMADAKVIGFAYNDAAVGGNKYYKNYYKK